MRVAIYCRVSSEKQRENTSLEYQRDQCMAYAEQHGMTVVHVLSDVESGDSSTRAGYLQLSDLVATRAIEAVIALRVDRLSRNTVHYGLLVNDMIAQGIELHYAERGRVSLDDEIRIDEFEILLAQGERKRIRKRLMQGKEALINNGQLLGHGNAPYGYYWQGEKRSKTIHIDDTEAQIVQSIFEWCVYEHMSSAKIAARLTSMGIPTPEESPHRPKKQRRSRGTGQWAACAVLRILHNPAYKGEFVNGRRALDYSKPKSKDDSRPRKAQPGQVIPIPAIVASELWQAAQDQLANNARRSKRNTKHFYLLGGGMITCSCGYTLTGTGQNRSTGPYRRYVCGGRYQGSEEGSTRILRLCTQKPYKAEIIETLAWEWVKEILTSEALHKAIELQKEQQGTRQDRLTSQIDQVMARQQQLDQQRAQDRHDYQDGLLTRDEMKRSAQHYEQASEEATAELARLHEELRQGTGSTHGLEMLAAQAAALQDVIALAEPEEQRELLEIIDFRMVVGDGYADVSCLLAADKLCVIASGPYVVDNHNNTITFAQRLSIAV